MVQLFFSVILGWMAFYWLPTFPALVAFAILLGLLTGRLSRSVKRGRRILAERRKAQGETAEGRPRGKYDGFLSLFYWRESMVHAMCLGMMAGGAFGAEGGFMGMGHGSGVDGDRQRCWLDGPRGNDDGGGERSAPGRQTAT